MIVCRKRRGAINSKQLSYLEHYRPKSRLRHKSNRNGHSQCLILWACPSWLVDTSPTLPRPLIDVLPALPCPLRYAPGPCEFVSRICESASVVFHLPVPACVCVCGSGSGCVFLPGSFVCLCVDESYSVMALTVSLCLSVFLSFSHALSHLFFVVCSRALSLSVSLLPLQSCFL